MQIAITRQVSPAVNRCELTHLERVPIDLERARRQHHAYEETLRLLGVEVHSLPEEPELPDSVFVEDAAIVLEECALLTRLGAEARRPESESVARALAPYRQLFSLQPPATLDGGDVLSVGKTIYIGLSSRSNAAALEQAQAFVKPYGYTVKAVRVSGCLHLKSAVTQVAADTLLLNPAWVEPVNFPALKIIEIDPSEPYAANALLVGASLLFQPAFPKTLRRMEAVGILPRLVDQSELGKAEGGLTCCALLFKN
jgi:dimethylargininase